MGNKNDFIRHIAFFVMIIGVMLVSGCTVNTVPIYVKNGKEYGRIKETFRNRWWNYYERAMSFAEGEFYQEAVTDLNHAIGQRMRDQRMARTYGMHFIDYFPHRELGIIYYQTRQLEASEKELELSLNHFPSAKARFYLDRVRRAMIEQQGKAVPPPGLVLDFERNTIWTRKSPIIISGTAKDENYISKIIIKAAAQTPKVFESPGSAYEKRLNAFDSLLSEGSRKQVSFEAPLSLAQGKHLIEVSARNLLGKTTTRTLIFHLDQEGPTISVEDIAFHGESGMTISGSAHDDAGISELSINGQPVAVQEGTETLFAETRPAVKDDLYLIARDRVGNITSARISLGKRAATGAGQRTEPSPRIMVASLASDMSGFLTASLFGPKDKTPPAIKLKGWADTQTVFLEKIYMEGEVSDESKIVSVGVNGVPILRREGRYVFFGHFADLRQGKNDILIEARDEAGNVFAKKISVIRKVPKALQLAERLSITVLPFGQSGQVSEFSVSFQDNLINALMSQNRFQMIERTRLDAILQEQKLSRTKLVDRETALKLGRLIAARSVLVGNIIETRTGIEIVARLVDTETSEILATEDVYDETKDLMASRSLSQGMAVKFHQDFPLVDGLVIQQKGNHILIDLGKELVKLRRGFIVYREASVTHPVTGKVLGTDNTIMGRVRITQVMPDLSKAEILGNVSAAIKPLDKVIAE